MKKTILLGCLLCAAGYTYAQPAKGTFILGGSLNFDGSNTSQGSSTIKTYNGGINPRFGYFLNEHFAIGIQGGYNYSVTDNRAEFSSTSSQETKSVTQTYSAGLFARYYKNMVGNLFFMVHGSALFGDGNTKSTTYINDNIVFERTTNNPSTVNIAFSPGFVYFMTPKLGVELSFGNLYGTFGDHNTRYGLSINGNTLAVGLHYYF